MNDSTDETDSLLKRVDAIFFDCDGVLLDSVHVKERVFRRLMEERIPAHASAAMDYYWRNGGTSRLEKFRWIWRNLVGEPLEETTVRRLGEEFADTVFRGVVECPMIPGAMEFLERFCPRLPAFVISGTPGPELERVVAARGLTKFFRGVFGSPDHKTAIGGRLLAEHRYDPRRVWFVGDATTDRDAARNLGVHFVGLDGPHLTPFLAPQETVIRDLTELARVILMKVEAERAPEK
jgi:phosphoglycolate phosphatase-like HAD superfamily hydrolase